MNSHRHKHSHHWANSHGPDVHAEEAATCVHTVTCSAVHGHFSAWAVACPGGGILFSPEKGGTASLKMWGPGLAA